VHLRSKCHREAFEIHHYTICLNISNIQLGLVMATTEARYLMAQFSQDHDRKRNTRSASKSNLLGEVAPGLPSTYYYDPAHHARELEAIWYREWICVGHTSDWKDEGEYRVFSLGDQKIIITKTSSGELKAYHNTCRHRGSELCSEKAGRFHSGRIVCPYHAWVYSLEGDLERAPRKVDTPDFDATNYSLYDVHLDSWGGFVFINLAEEPQISLLSSLGIETDYLTGWPLTELRLAHRESHVIQCNWKIFWENFMECYHCPGIHKDLSRIVPLYKEAVFSTGDLPDSNPLKHTTERLAPGASTWSDDGDTPLPTFEALSEEDRAAGMSFSTFIPSVYLVAHVDYVRSVCILPLGPEQTQITVSWMLHADTLKNQKVDIDRLTRFARQVVMEDLAACELNQRGIKSIRHNHGVLMPQEYDVLTFNNWIRQQLS
jgi:Rieske 2Fe-2S family protein